MRLFSLAIVYSLSFIGLLSLYKQIQVTDNLLNALLQVPMVVGLIYLVLKLEDKRQASAMVREDTFRSIVDSLLGVIVEMSTMVNPSKVSSDQIKSLEKYLKSQYSQEEK
jgi:hypothetical protein